MNNDLRTANWKEQEPEPLDPLKHHAPGSEQYVRHPSHATPGIHVNPDKLYVLTMLENPLRFRRRYANYWRFADHMEKGGAELFTAEIAFGNRKFEVTEPNNPRHLQLRTYCEFWHKENALNLLAQRLPPDCKYLAVFDADIQFARSNWKDEILHLLQHYDVLQPFSHSQDLGPNDEPLDHAQSRSFLYQWVEHGFAPHSEEFMEEQFVQWTKQGVIRGGRQQFQPYMAGAQGWHPGLAWCYRKTAWDQFGGMMEWLPTGSGDWHMANAMIGNLMQSINPAHTESYKRQCKIWQERALKIRDNPNGGLGYMPGLILHSFHGSKANRQYEHRHQFVINVEFDPDLDLKRDHQGLWQLTERSPKLRDGLRIYARARNEDGQ